MRAKTEALILAGAMALTLTACDKPAATAPAPVATVDPVAAEETWEPIIREESWYEPTEDPEATPTPRTRVNLDATPTYTESFDLMDGHRDADDDPAAGFTPEPAPEDDRACTSGNFEQVMFEDACEDD